MTAMAQDMATTDRSAASSVGYRTLLVHVQPRADSAPRLDAAISLARKLDATLFGLGAQIVPSFAAGDPYGLTRSDWLPEMHDLMRINLERAEALFRKAAASISTEWVTLEEPPGQAMARISSGADLIVAGGAKLELLEPHHACDTAELILKSGRPVLIVPPDGGVLAADVVVVAWKDTRESRRALADALPFLKAARAVVVMEICGEGDEEGAKRRTDAVVDGLKRHGVAARSNVVVAPDRLVCSELLFEAERVGSDLIVAGAYSHSRFGEQLFGGVTRDLLGQDETFVLMSH